MSDINAQMSENIKHQYIEGVPLIKYRGIFLTLNFMLEFENGYSISEIRNICVILDLDS